MWCDPAVTAYTSKQAATEAQTWARILTYVGHWATLGFGYWVVEERDTGAFVGEVGFADFRREVTPSIGGIPEGGWVLSPAMRGRGYASEALASPTGQDGVPHLPGKCAVAARGGKGRLPRVCADYLSRRADDPA
jgi:hypothetical protein